MNEDSSDGAKARIEWKRTESIIGAFYEVYNYLGPGLLEKAYSGAMAHELRLRGHTVDGETPVAIRYKGIVVARYRTDRVVDDKVVIEIKSTKYLTEADHRQLVNLLRATRWEVGLLMHFGDKPVFHRYVSTNDDPFKYGAREHPPVQERDDPIQ